MNSNSSTLTWLSVPLTGYDLRLPPIPRKVSQKEKRKKSRYRRSQGIRA